MKRYLILLVIFFTISEIADITQVLAKEQTLYVVTRSTKKFKLNKVKNPIVGLFSTKNNGKKWRHYGWNYTKCFSASTAKFNKNQIFYLACGNGVQKSEDGGKTWRIATGYNVTECLKTVIDPENPEIVYAATAYGLIKTTDGGNSWIEINKGLTSTFTPTLIIDKQDNNVLFCATESGIHKSENGGKLWKPISLLGFGIRIIIQHPTNYDILAVGTENDGVFISEDHGKTWQRKVKGLKHKTIYSLAFTPQNTKTIYAGSFRGGIYKSENLGKRWQPVNTNLTNLDIHAMLVDPKDEKRVYAGTLNGGIWMSENAGESWEFIGLETSQVWDIFID